MTHLTKLVVGLLMEVLGGMCDTLFIRTLKQTVKELKAESARLLVKLEDVDLLVQPDPEESLLHDIWHAYRMQTDFKEFVEELLREHYNKVHKV